MNVDDIKLAGKKQHLDPMCKVLNKEVDLGDPTSFLDHENLGCIQRQCEISKDIVDNYRIMFEPQSIFFRALVWLLLYQRVLSVVVLLLPLIWLQQP